MPPSPAWWVRRGARRRAGRDRHGRPGRPPITTVAPAITAVAPAITTLAPAAAPFGPLAALVLLHHGRGLVLQFLNPDAHVAQHVLVQAQAPFRLVQGGRGRVHIQHEVVTLAVLLHAISQTAKAPVFLFGDIAATLCNHLGHLIRQLVNLVGGQILPGDHHGFIKTHDACVPFGLSQPTRRGHRSRPVNRTTGIAGPAPARVPRAPPSREWSPGQKNPRPADGHAGGSREGRHYTHPRTGRKPCLTSGARFHTLPPAPRSGRSAPAPARGRLGAPWTQEAGQR